MDGFYNLEKVRNFILRKGLFINTAFFSSGNYPPSDISSSFPENWEYCPCATINLCNSWKKKMCSVRIGLSQKQNTNTDNSLFIEIIFLKDINKGIIRANQMLLNAYLDKENVNKDDFKL
jgi:hypothetical protein